MYSVTVVYVTLDDRNLLSTMEHHHHHYYYRHWWHSSFCGLRAHSTKSTFQNQWRGCGISVSTAVVLLSVCKYIHPYMICVDHAVGTAAVPRGSRKIPHPLYLMDRCSKLDYSAPVRRRMSTSTSKSCACMHLVCIHVKSI